MLTQAVHLLAETRAALAWLLNHCQTTNGTTMASHKYTWNNGWMLLAVPQQK